MHFMVHRVSMSIGSREKSLMFGTREVRESHLREGGGEGVSQPTVDRIFRQFLQTRTGTVRQISTGPLSFTAFPLHYSLPR